MIVVGRSVGSAQVYDAATGQRLVVLPGHGGDVNGVAWAPSSTMVATASGDGTVKVWSLFEGGGRPLVTVTADDARIGFSEVEFSADGSRIVTAARGGTALVWRIDLDATAEVAGLPGAAFGPGVVRFGGDGRHLLATGGGGGLTVWDSTGWRAVRSLGPRRPDAGPSGLVVWTPRDSERMAVSPDGRLAAAIAAEAMVGFSGMVTVHDVDGGSTGFSVDLGGSAQDASWSRDGQFLAIAGSAATAPGPSRSPTGPAGPSARWRFRAVSSGALGSPRTITS
jgi:WD40 repeat protein